MANHASSALWKKSKINVLFCVCGQKMAATNNHFVLLLYLLGGRALTSLWCKTSSPGLLLLHWCRLTSLRLLAHDESTSSPISPHHGWSVCACICLYVDYQWLRRQASRWCGNMCRESQIPLYPKPLRLRDDGQLYTHQRLGHQRLSVGWAANEVWRDWLV